MSARASLLRIRSCTKDALLQISETLQQLRKEQPEGCTSNGPLIPKEDKLRQLNLRVIFPNSRCLASCKVRSKRRGLKITGIEGIVYLFAE